MIASQCREEDKEFARVVLDILEITTRCYQRTEDPKLLEKVIEFNNWYDIILEKIKYGDYTQDEGRRATFDKFLEKYYGYKN
tara:strand:+ start:7510 stop:7755 length:246 start_codon:yes stop_codon:yes gene_type:complete